MPPGTVTRFVLEKLVLEKLVKGQLWCGYLIAVPVLGADHDMSPAPRAVAICPGWHWQDVD